MDRINELLEKKWHSKYDIIELRTLLVEKYGDIFKSNSCFCNGIQRKAYISFVKKELNKLND